ncbi:DUF5651 domain-containing protein, partial [Caloramator sp. CAR-1]
IQNRLKQQGTNALMKAAANAAEERAKELATRAVEDYIIAVSDALEHVLREKLGFGDKRLAEFAAALNEHLPNHFQYNIPKKFELKKKKKVTQEKLIDLSELLLELGCDEKCKMACKNFKECKFYKIFKSRDIEEYDLTAKGCPYQITPANMDADELRIKKQVFIDRWQRIIMSEQN